MFKKMLLTALVVGTYSLPKAVSATLAARSIPSSFLSASAPKNRPIIDQLLAFARQHLSIRYRSGGTTRSGFDCSGFTRYCFQQFGLALPHSSAAQGDVGVAVDKRNAQPGDLILFEGHKAGSNRIGHVGLITEVIGNKITFIHSAWSGGVRYDYLDSDYYSRRFMGVRRVTAALLAAN